MHTYNLTSQFTHFSAVTAADGSGVDGAVHIICNGLHWYLLRWQIECLKTPKPFGMKGSKQ